MIFSRKKQTVAPASPPVMRSRDRVENHDNPLARRFHPEDEPDTIDLQQPTGFNDEPGTAELAKKLTASETVDILTFSSETGKIYAHPGQVDQQVYLDDEAVLAPTELRPGDRLRIGKLELYLSRVAKEE